MINVRSVAQLSAAVAAHGAVPIHCPKIAQGSRGWTLRVHLLGVRLRSTLGPRGPLRPPTSGSEYPKNPEYPKKPKYPNSPEYPKNPKYPNNPGILVFFWKHHSKTQNIPNIQVRISIRKPDCQPEMSGISRISRTSPTEVST